jgi:phosphoglycolate phosphatase
VRCNIALFDLDGTLVDSRYAITSCINHALRVTGLPERELASLEGFIGGPLREAFLELGGDEERADACLAAYRGRYPSLSLTDTPVFDGIHEMLRSIALPKAIVTSKPAAYAEPLVAALGLREFFSGVFGPSLEALAEPKQTTLERALEALPADSEPVLVGDRIHDIDAARAHGIPVIGVLWGIGSAQELAPADSLVATPRELAELLAQSTGRDDRDGVTAVR